MKKSSHGPVFELLPSISERKVHLINFTRSEMNMAGKVADILD